MADSCGILVHGLATVGSVHLCQSLGKCIVSSAIQYRHFCNCDGVGSSLWTPSVLAEKFLLRSFISPML